MDRSIIVLRLAASPEMRLESLERVAEFARQYFDSIQGCSTALFIHHVDPPSTTKARRQEHKVEYILNQRGASYASLRDGVVYVAKRSRVSLLRKAKTCVQNLLTRHRSTPKDRKPYLVGTWMGPEPAPEGTPLDDPLRAYPQEWMVYESVCLPEFCQHRSAASES